jgi:LysR family hydrogen peroxide-inducible transcriptional activator
MRTLSSYHLALVDLPLSDPLLAVEKLWTEELILITPHGWPLPAGPVCLESVRTIPFISMEPGYGLRDALFRLAQSRGFNPIILHELTSIGAIIGFVEQGFGISVVPERAVELEIRSRHLGFTRLVPENTRDIGIIWRAHRRIPEPARTFLTFLRSKSWYPGYPPRH